MVLSVFSAVILGVLQGFFEWLPVSSEGIIFLFLAYSSSGALSAGEFIRIALFLHLGTFFAALIYFKKEVKEFFRTFLNYKNSNLLFKKSFNFLVLSTLVTSIVGLGFLILVDSFDFSLTGRGITLLVGLMLLGTGFIQLSSHKNAGVKSEVHFNKTNSSVLGLLQGLAVLPGVSRSGITVSAFLLGGFDKKVALRFSFLMSLPVVLFGNIILNFSSSSFVFTFPLFLSLLASFISGILTIHLLMRFAERVNFGVFVLIFAVLTLLSGVFFL